MTPTEAKKFIEDAKARGEANARKWHTSTEIQKRTRLASQSACSKIRDRE